MAIFNEERSAYYKAKKRELVRIRESEQVIKQDALFIFHYGMSAYIELIPAIKGFGVDWHEKVLKELEALRVKHLAEQLSGFYMAVAATKNKKANRKFRKMIKGLMPR